MSPGQFYHQTDISIVPKWGKLELIKCSRQISPIQRHLKTYYILKLSLNKLISNQNTPDRMDFSKNIIFKYVKIGRQINNQAWDILKISTCSNIPIHIVHNIISLFPRISTELISLPMGVITDKGNPPP